jgi:hypothetical protein
MTRAASAAWWCLRPYSGRSRTEFPKDDRAGLSLWARRWIGVFLAPSLPALPELFTQGVLEFRGNRRGALWAPAWIQIGPMVPSHAIAERIAIPAVPAFLPLCGPVAGCAPSGRGCLFERRRALIPAPAARTKTGELDLKPANESFQIHCSVRSGPQRPCFTRVARAASRFWRWVVRCVTPWVGQARQRPGGTGALGWRLPSADWTSGRPSSGQRRR